MARALVVALAAALLVVPSDRERGPGSRYHRHRRPRALRHGEPRRADEPPDYGLQTGTEKAVGLDMRPATGQLFLVTVPVGVVASAIDPQLLRRPCDGGRHIRRRASRAPSRAPPTCRPASTSTRSSIACASSTRTTRTSGSTRPTASLAGDDPNLTFTAPATGPVTAVAYDRNIAPGPPGTIAPPGTLTTLYGIDVGSGPPRHDRRRQRREPGRAERRHGEQPRARSPWRSTTPATPASTSPRTARLRVADGRRAARSLPREPGGRRPPR